MQIRVDAATTNQLNWLVAKCMEVQLLPMSIAGSTCCIPARGKDDFYDPVCDLEQGGQIIDKEGIATSPTPNGEWKAWKPFPIEEAKYVWGRTRQLAAMRCFVCSRLGGVVEIADGLQ